MSCHEESPRSKKVLRTLRTIPTTLPIAIGRLAIAISLSSLLSSVAVAQNDPRELLIRARQNVLNTIDRLPKYLCTQNVDRMRYQSAHPERTASGHHPQSCDDTIAEARSTGRVQRLLSSDRLRFDVAVSASFHPNDVNEMYSWAGEERFGDRDLFEFVHDGSISTGSFSSMLASIFGGDAATFSYNGDRYLGSRLLSEFGFRVAQDKSRYTYVFGDRPNQQTRMAYDGTILIDPETSELVRLTIRSDQLPAETGACELTQTLDYNLVRLHDADFLLPTQVKVSLIHSDGSEAENQIQYSSCREFRGKSVIRFPVTEQAEVRLSSSARPEPSFSLPSGLPFKVVFTDSIDTATAAAGDPIRGRVETAIRDHASNLLVPEGTVVTGRIMNIRRYYEPSRTAVSDDRTTSGNSSWATVLIGPHPDPLPSQESRNSVPNQAPLVIQIKLEKLELEGGSVPLYATFNSGLHRFAKSKQKLAKRVEIGSLEASQDPGTGVFAFWDSSPTYVVKGGLESNWVTTSH
jgi:hypothetical protein